MTGIQYTEEGRAILDFIHARIEDDRSYVGGISSEVHDILDPLKMLVESRPAVENPAAFDDVDRQREYTWKCIALIWKAHPDYRKEWRP